MFCLSCFALNKHIINTVTCFSRVPELHSINIFDSDVVFRFIGSVNRNLATLQTGFR